MKRQILEFRSLSNVSLEFNGEHEAFTKNLLSLLTNLNQMEAYDDKAFELNEIFRVKILYCNSYKYLPFF